MLTAHVNYQPPWLVTTLRIFRRLPVLRRLPAALDWRDELIEALTKALDEQLRDKDTGEHTQDVQVKAVQSEVLPEPMELELYRLRSQLNRAIDRAEKERMLRVQMEHTAAAP